MSSSKVHIIKVTLLLSMSYFLYGMMRKSIPVSTPMLLSNMEFTKSDIGLLSASFGVGFGVSKVIGGVICDCYSCKLILVIGVLTASLSTLSVLLILPNGYTCERDQSVGVMSALVTDMMTVLEPVRDMVGILQLGRQGWFRVLWFCHGFAQGVGWPAIASLIYDNFDVIGRGTVWSIISSAGNVGSILVPLIYLPNLEKDSWQFVFLSLGISGVVGSFLIFFGLSDKSRSLSQTNVKVVENESTNNEKPRWKLLLRVELWLLIGSNAITSFLMTSVSDWLGQYLIEVCHITDVTQIKRILFSNEVGGFIGTLSSGIICDIIFKGRSDLSCLFYSLLFIPAIILLPSNPLVGNSLPSYLSTHSNAIASAALLGLAINGPKTLSGMALRNMIRPPLFGLGGGLLGVFAQVGVFVSGTFIGWLLQQYHWSYFSSSLLYSSLLSSCLLVIMLRIGDNNPIIIKKIKEL